MPIKISKHLQECLATVVEKAKATFTADDFPFINRTDWVMRKLKDAGYLERLMNLRYRLKKRSCDSCGDKFVGMGFPMTEKDGPDPYKTIFGMEQCEKCYRAGISASNEK